MSNWLNYLGSQALKKGNTESHLLFLPSLLLHQKTNFPPLRSPSASEAEGDISDFDFTFTDRKKTIPTAGWTFYCSYILYEAQKGRTLFKYFHFQARLLKECWDKIDFEADSFF